MRTGTSVLDGFGGGATGIGSRFGGVREVTETWRYGEVRFRRHDEHIHDLMLLNRTLCSSRGRSLDMTETLILDLGRPIQESKKCDIGLA